MIYYHIKLDQLVLINVLAQCEDTVDWVNLPTAIPGFVFVGYL